MSQQASGIDAAFSQWFNYSEKRAPRVATLEELLKSCLFLESSPATFSFSSAGPRGVPLPDQYRAFLNFTKKHPAKAPLSECLFPLFCHIVMDFRRRDDEDSVTRFADAHLPTAPPHLQDDARRFVQDSDHYHNLVHFFSTQRYIVKADDESANLLNEFVNEPANCELRRLVVEHIILDPVREETPDRRTVLRFPLSSGAPSLSVLQCRVRSANFAAVANDLSDIYAAIGDQTVVKIDTSSSALKTLYKHPAAITTMSLSHESKVLLTADIIGNMHLWSSSASARVSSVRQSVWSSAFAPRGGIFAVGSSDELVRLYDTERHRQHRVFVGHSSPVTDVGFHPNCSLLGSLALDPACRVWDLREAATVRLFIGKRSKNAAIAFSSDGKLVAFYDGDVSVCDIGTCNQVFRKQVHVHPVVHLSFSMDCRFVYVVGPNSEVLVCNINDEAEPVKEAMWMNGHVVDCEMMPANALKIIVSYE
jgi:transcription initiation factor TFIID subunit 5